MDNIGLIFKHFALGVIDSFKGIGVLFTIDKEINKRQAEEYAKAKMRSKKEPPKPPESKVAKRFAESILLNGGIFLASILCFDYVLKPAFQYAFYLIVGESTTLISFWTTIITIIDIIFRTCWVAPMFLLSKIVSSLWFQDIGDMAYKFRKGRPHGISVTFVAADFFYSLIVQTIFLLQCSLVRLVPINWLGIVLNYSHMAFLYALYAFEYKWCNMGWKLHTRLSYIENNWPYFFGFGLPLTIFTALPNSLVISACIFSLFFPLFILSANEAIPKASPNLFPIRVFTPIVMLSNYVFDILISKYGKQYKPRAPVSVKQQQPDLRKQSQTPPPSSSQSNVSSKVSSRASQRTGYSFGSVHNQMHSIR